MKIELNEARCEGYGFCQERAPELVELDADGILHILKDEVDDADVERAQRAVRSCPVAALMLSEHV